MPAHTLKGESRQLGAEPLAEIAELIESTARLCIETHRFPDELVPQVVELRRLFEQTVAAFDQETNPIRRRAGAGLRPQGRQSGFRPDLARASAASRAGANGARTSRSSTPPPRWRSAPPSR